MPRREVRRNKEPIKRKNSNESKSPEEVDILQKFMESQEVQDMITSFKDFSQEKRDEIINMLSMSIGDRTTSDLGDSYNSAASELIKQLLGSGKESAESISPDLTASQDANRLLEACTIDDNSQGGKKPRLSETAQAEENRLVCQNEPSEYSALSPILNVEDTKPVIRNANSMRRNYSNNLGDEDVRSSSITTDPSFIGFNSCSNYGNGNAILRVFLVPQDKGRSRNFDYVGGTPVNNPDADQYIFCRGRPTVVPFAVGMENVLPQDTKLKVQVVFNKIKSKVPVRCSNHKEGDETIWRDQLMISTDPNAQALSYQEGHGFVVEPTPQRCDVIFLCRNSCRSGYEKDWLLQFTLLSKDDSILSVKTMSLRVCEVPHRDMMKSKVKYEWDPSISTIESPIMKVMSVHKSSDVKNEEKVVQRLPTDVYPIYVSGHSTYCEVMRFVGSLEAKKRYEHPVIRRAVEHMRDWNKGTSILRFLQPICGVETPIVLEKFNQKEVHTLGDLYNKYTADFFPSLQISAALSSSLGALYLNWRNIMENYDLTIARHGNSTL